MCGPEPSDLGRKPIQHFDGATRSRAGKSFEVQVGPDQGHSGLRPERMMEFFIENLVMNERNQAGTSSH